MLLEKAKEHLVDTVSNYKVNLGKSVVDQMLLVPAELHHLVWWLFPS